MSAPCKSKLAKLVVGCFTKDKDILGDVARKLSESFGPPDVTSRWLPLATGKNYTHRIYLRTGIYADLTLIYREGRFHPLDWTYPDYAGDAITRFLGSVRDLYLYQVRESGG